MNDKYRTHTIMGTMKEQCVWGKEDMGCFSEEGSFTRLSHLC